MEMSFNISPIYILNKKKFILIRISLILIISAFSIFEYGHTILHFSILSFVSLLFLYFEAEHWLNLNRYSKNMNLVFEDRHLKFFAGDLSGEYDLRNLRIRGVDRNSVGSVSRIVLVELGEPKIEMELQGYLEMDSLYKKVEATIPFE